jgi:uncharacterized protein with HEPN domain
MPHVRPSLPFKDKRHLLLDIVASIDHIRSFAAGIAFEQYLQDRKTRSAVERELLIISEAAVRLGSDAEAICPGPDWRDIRGLGNKLRHDYDGLNDELLWQTVQSDLLPLRKDVEKALQHL